MKMVYTKHIYIQSEIYSMENISPNYVQRNRKVYAYEVAQSAIVNIENIPGWLLGA